MTRRRILIALAVILLTPVVVLGVLALAVRSEWAERLIESMVSAKLDREVR